MAARDETHCPEDLQDGDLGLGVLGAEALGDGVDSGGMRQHVGPTSLEEFKYCLFFSTKKIIVNFQRFASRLKILFEEVCGRDDVYDLYIFGYLSPLV